MQKKISEAEKRHQALEVEKDDGANEDLNQSIQCIDKARSLEGEVTALRTAKASIVCRLGFSRAKYDKMKTNLPF